MVTHYLCLQSRNQMHATKYMEIRNQKWNIFELLKAPLGRTFHNSCKPKHIKVDRKLEAHKILKSERVPVS